LTSMTFVVRRATRPPLPGTGQNDKNGSMISIEPTSSTRTTSVSSILDSQIDIYSTPWTTRTMTSERRARFGAIHLCFAGHLLTDVLPRVPLFAARSSDSVSSPRTDSCSPTCPSIGRRTEEEVGSGRCCSASAQWAYRGTRGGGGGTGREGGGGKEGDGGDTGY
jgi:hypothetical protein